MRTVLFPSPSLWETPEITEINRLPMHATFHPYDSVSAALGGDPHKSKWVRSLNGTWKLRVLPHPGLVRPSHVKAGLDTRRWGDVPVPANWNLHGFGKPPQYTNVVMPFENKPPRVPETDNPTGIYRMTFTLPPAWKNRRTVIHFGGVESCFFLHCNGQFVGMSKDSRLPAEFDLTSFIRPGANELAVICLQYSDASYIEDQDHWWMAGIFRDVYLYSTGPVFIEDVRINADYDPATGRGLFGATVKLGTAAEPEAAYSATVQLYDGRKPLWRNPLLQTIPRSYREGYAEAHVARTVARVKAWNTEEPHLYTVVVTLADSTGRSVQHTAVRIGFRRCEIANRQFLLNGKAVYIKGANHHDHDPDCGKAVRREWMERDVVLMKQFNLNAIRTSHYPSDPALYDLCDQYGILVIDEANIENHANYPTLCHNPRWRKPYVERITRMVQRDRNHPCIFAWSLCNESGYGENHDAAAELVRRMDATRLIHNEGAVKPHWNQRGPNQYGAGGERSNDFIDPMYPHVADIVKWARTTRERRPFIMCEYCSTTGNSGGCLKEYWDAIYAHHGLQGGFIWQWLDHGLRRLDGTGHPYWAYGGDFGETVHDYNFHCNGLVSSDRRPHPALYEYKKLLQPIAVVAQDLTAHRFTILNRDCYRSSDWLDASWRLEVDGRARQTGRIACSVQPGQSKALKLPITPFRTPPGTQAVVTFAFRAKRKTPWCPRGHDVAWEQFILASPPIAAKRATIRRTVHVRNHGRHLVATAGETEVVIDRRAGGIETLRRAGKPVLLQGPVFNLWRAPIDNDGMRARPDHRTSQHKLLGRWLAAGYDRLRTRVTTVKIDDSDPHRLVVAVSQHILPARGTLAFLHRARYAFTGDGALRCEHTFTMPKGLPEPARLGVMLIAAPECEQMEWVGRGPHESYPDRKAGAALGLYQGTVRDQHHDYVVPQENGLKVDTQRFTLHGPGVTASFRAGSADGFAFSVQHYTPQGLEQALHTNEVAFVPETVILIDAVHRGVGSAACGPDTLPAYRIQPGRHKLAYEIRLG